MRGQTLVVEAALIGVYAATIAEVVQIADGRRARGHPAEIDLVTCETAIDERVVERGEPRAGESPRFLSTLPRRLVQDDQRIQIGMRAFGRFRAVQRQRSRLRVAPRGSADLVACIRTEPV